MNLDEYEELTGKRVADNQRAVITAHLDRAQILLEEALGFPLDPEVASENLYTEEGVGAYRLYPYNNLDKFWHVDPFTAVHGVKLIKIDEVTDLEVDEFRAPVGRGGWGKYIERIYPGRYWDFNRTCNTAGWQIAVDADWLGAGTEDDGELIPIELKLVIADLATHYGDANRNIRSESLGTRSYSKFEPKAPLEDSATKAVLGRYAGPHGTAGRMPV